MKKLTLRFLATVFLLAVLAIPAAAREALVPVGRAIGLELTGQGLTVAGFDEAWGENARKAGLSLGDTILKADGQSLEGAEALRDLVAQANGSVTLTLLTPTGTRELKVAPAQTPEGKRLGIFVREGITGIGTITYYDPETGSIGTLGHGVSDRRGALLPLAGGKIYPAEILSVVRGKAGTPGQLQGAFSSREPLGFLEKNTPFGVFGTAAPFPGTPVPLGSAEEIHTGEALILSDLTGTGPREYTVEILQVYPNADAAGRNLLLHVTDQNLLRTTGGIVQGMSGSPILQDGKFIGAVTHVLVNNPTRGYGIFLENMLDAA